MGTHTIVNRTIVVITREEITYTFTQVYDDWSQWWLPTNNRNWIRPLTKFHCWPWNVHDFRNRLSRYPTARSTLSLSSTFSLARYSRTMCARSVWFMFTKLDRAQSRLSEKENKMGENRERAIGSGNIAPFHSWMCERVSRTHRERSLSTQFPKI